MSNIPRPHTNNAPKSEIRKIPMLTLILVCTMSLKTSGAFPRELCARGFMLIIAASRAGLCIFYLSQSSLQSLSGLCGVGDGGRGRSSVTLKLLESDPEDHLGRRLTKQCSLIGQPFVDCDGFAYSPFFTQVIQVRCCIAFERCGRHLTVYHRAGMGQFPNGKLVLLPLWHKAGNHQPCLQWRP